MTRTLTLAGLAGLLLLALVLMAGGAAAHAQQSPQTYPIVHDEHDAQISGITIFEWDAGSNQWSDDGATIDGDTQGSDPMDVANDGLMLVKATYTPDPTLTDTDAQSITFRLNESGDWGSSGGPEFMEYTFLIDANTGLHVEDTDQTVHLAKGLSVDEGANPPVSTGDGCGDGVSVDLRTGGTCYFLIDTSVRDTSLATFATSGGANSLGTATWHLKVIVNAEDGVHEEGLGDSSTAVVEGRDRTVSVESRTIPNPETGVFHNFEMELQEDGETLTGVDAWLCIFRPLTPGSEDPAVDEVYHDATVTSLADPTRNTMGGQLVLSGADQSGVLGCQPVQDPNNEDTDIDGDADGQPDGAVAMGISSGDDTLQTRRVQLRWNVLAESQGDWEDQFYVRTIVRDFMGNYIIQDLDQATSEIQVTSYDPEVTPQEIPVTNPTPQDFEDEAGCELLADPPTATDPCQRRLQNTAPYASFSFPIILENRGNVQDSLALDWSRESGRQDWGVSFVDPQTGSELGSTVSVPAASSPTEPGTRTVHVQLQPSDTSVAADYRTTPSSSVNNSTIRVLVRSTDSSAQPQPTADTYLRGELVPIREAELTFGAPGSTVAEATTELEPDQTTTIPVNLTNTGNTWESLLFEKAPGADPVCTFTGSGADKIALRLIDADTGQVDSDRTRNLRPGVTDNLAIRVDVGENVAASQGAGYRCDLRITGTDQADANSARDVIPLTPQAPRILIDVQGIPQIRILELRGTDDTEVDITGETITRVVPPGTNPSRAFQLFLENNGSIALDVEMDVTKGEDLFDLNGRWQGLNASTTPPDTFNAQTFAQTFALDVSDTDDRLRISDHLPVNAANGWDDLHGPWRCISENEDSGNTEVRSVCQARFQFSTLSRTALEGDEVTYTFSFQDPSQTAPPAEVTLHLVYDHVGQVDVRSVSDRAVNDSTTTINYEATLEDGHRFDPDASSVSARLHITTTDGQTCTSPVGRSLTSFSKGLQEASFRAAIRPVADGTTTGCSAGSGSPIPVTVGSSTTLLARLDVRDENGTLLSSTTPARINVVDGANPSLPSQATDLSQGPAEEMDANGTQFANMAFNYDDDLQGVLLSRSQGLEGLAHLADCVGPAFDSGSLPGGLGWIAVPGDTNPGAISTDPPSSSVTRPGQILHRQQDEAIPRGTVTIYGWGDSAIPALNWTEGVNSLVFYVADEEGDPASNTVSPNLEMKMLNRASSGQQVEDRYTWTTSNLDVRNLGHGFYAADIVLPDGLADQANLDDHPDGSSNAIFGNWTLHMSLSGSSRDGDTLTGDAYWDMAGLDMEDADGIWSDETATLSRNLTSDTATTETWMHAGVKFLPWDPASAPWTTGPGVQDLSVKVFTETIQPGRSVSIPGEPDANTDDVRDHTFQQGTSRTVDVLYSPANRLSFVRSTTLSVDGDTHTGPLAFPDLGVDGLPWLLQVKVRGTQGELDSESWTLNVDRDIQAASNGIPMPLCLSEPAGDPTNIADQAGDFDTEDFTGRTVLDLRAVPGLTVDRGPFSLTPFLTNTAQGLRHDAQETFQILGEGLVTLSSTEVSQEGEVGVSIPISVIASGPVDHVEVLLEKDGAVESSATLTEGDDDSYMGEITPAEEGTYTLKIRAFDEAGGVTIVTKTVSVVANAKPRITFTQPVPVDGVRAIAPDGTVTARVSDRSAREGGISVLVKQAAGSGPEGPVDIVSDDGNLTIAGLGNELATGTKSTTVTLINTTNDSQPIAGATVWLNVTPEGGTETAALDGLTTDSAGEVTDDVELSTAGTYSVTVEARNVTDDGEVETWSHTFEVTVVEGSGGSGDFTELTDGVSTSCAVSECTVDISAQAIGATDEFSLKVAADFGEDDTNESRVITVTIDDTDPQPALSIGQPKGSGTPTPVSPSTRVTASATDNTAVASLTVTAIRSSTELGTVNIQDAEGEVSLNELGLSEDGEARIRVTATDIAGNEATTDQVVEVDATGPVVSNANVSKNADGVVVRVNVNDDAGVGSVTLFFQRPGANGFTSTAMTANNNRYQATVTNVGDTGTFRYYVQAQDDLGNRGQLATENTPRTLQLGDVPTDTNTAPTVTITSPSEGDRVSGTLEVTFETDDAEGDVVEVRNVRIAPASGSAVNEQPTEGTLSVDTTQFAEGRTVITVEAYDGTATGTGQVAVIVDNKPDAGSCDDEPLETGSNVPVCFRLDDPDVTEVKVELMRNGEIVGTQTLSPASDAIYRTTFDIDEEGSYTLKITKTKSDGTTEETTSEPFTVQSAGGAGSPTGRLIVAIVLGVLVMGGAAFAAFGRWK